MATTTKKDLIDWIADETGQKRTTVKRTVRVPVPAKRTVKFKVGRLMKIALELNAQGDVVRHKEAARIRTAHVPVTAGAQNS
jgi:hypothetical protein